MTESAESNSYVIRPSFSNKFAVDHIPTHRISMAVALVKASFCSNLFFALRYRPNAVKEVLHAVMTRRLANQVYDPENTPKMTKEIADEVKQTLKRCVVQHPLFFNVAPPSIFPPTLTHRRSTPTEMQQLERYKFVVQVVMGEQRGEGVKYVIQHSLLFSLPRFPHTQQYAHTHTHTGWLVVVSGIRTQMGSAVRLTQTTPCSVWQLLMEYITTDGEREPSHKHTNFHNTQLVALFVVIFLFIFL